MALFNKNKSGGFMDVIRCDEPSYLMWKWHPSGSQAGSNRRENAIRWGSSLRVKDGEVAVFVYNQANGVVQDCIEGPFDETIKTANFPVLASIVGLAFDGGSPFQAEVYFINLARIIQVKFGVPFFDVFDPRFLDFGVPTAVRGTISFKISDYLGFIKLHRLRNFSLDEFQAEIRDAVSRYVKSVVSNAPAEHNIPLLQIERKVAEINGMVEAEIGSRLAENFGVEVSGVDISTIEIDKGSAGFKQLKSVTQDVATATIQAQTAVNIKDTQDKQRIEAENYEETLRVQREEAQYAQHKHTQSSNFAAFQVESQTAIGVAGAEALGQMGANGAGDVSLGGGGFNPAAMMAGMAVGGAVGQNIAGTMNNMMSGVNQPPTTPPPVPPVAFNVAVDGQPTGPYTLQVLKQMAVAGQLDPSSLVWKDGMSEWAKAESVEELKSLFVVPPLIPTAE
ncbi:MAG: SPFH domain-containing protein [Oscillospiraceae bacterium]|jgi:membrane protease subunit (stomatin/prohibitin family)|nr:SPFH domain-containing protein [Oscillospiraceae bacterium]